MGVRPDRLVEPLRSLSKQLEKVAALNLRRSACLSFVVLAGAIGLNLSCPVASAHEMP